MRTSTTSPQHATRLRILAAIATTFGALSCADAPSAVQPDMSHALSHASAVRASERGVSAAGLEKAVHAATARFHSTTQATKAGYAVASPCVAHPTLGAMGFHWVNQSLVDPIFDPMRPEALVYAPNDDGTLRLVAAEYIVIDVGQPRPSFDGVPFDIGGTPVPVPHYSLHAWVHQENPAGTFTPFNPAVTCPPPAATE